MKRFYSLKGKKVFQKVFRRGRRFNRSEIQLIAYKISKNDEYLLKNNEKVTVSNSVKKVGIIIGKKFGNAVVRNTAKRRVRSICCEILLEAEDDFLVILRPANSFKNLSYEKSRKIIMSLFEQAGVR